MKIKCRVYDIAGALNVRDMGGYKAKDGRVTAYGRFIRSAALASIGGAGADAFAGMKIDCVVDLRSSLERKRAPDAVETRGEFHFEHVPMLDHIQSDIVSGTFTGFPSSMAEMYIGLLDESPLSFKAVFDLFADTRFSRYIFHCTAGKDRTGLVAMLLLGLAGVDDKTIIEDYSYTERLSKRPQAAVYAGLPDYLFSSAPESMRETLDYIYKKYGGIPRYLERIGVDGEMRGRITAKLFAEDA